MLVRIDPDGDMGLADQIAAQVRRAVVTGVVAAGERLPPARQLASGLGVNMHTVLSAYADLRDEGLIELRRGRGAHVRRDVDVGSVDIRHQVKALVKAADRIGMSYEDLVAEVIEETRT